MTQANANAKTFSNRSNAKRAMVTFRDKYPNFSDVGLSIVRAFEEGDQQRIVAQNVHSEWERKAALDSGFQIALMVEPAEESEDLIKTKSTKPAKVVPSKAQIAADKAAKKTARDAARAEVAKTKAEVKEAKVAKPKAEKPAKEPKRVLRADGLAEGTGAARMIDTLIESGDAGVTYDDLLKASGWAQCRPAFMAAVDKAGVKLTQDKTQKPMRYFGTYKSAKSKAA